ncbi:MAG: AAA family ATPase [Paludibacteraceae bacterium]
MGQSLKEIAQQLRDTDKKVQLIYAFNGVGKTRLSREFKELIVPKDEEEHDKEKPVQILYYNAFTEDLFYWDNDLDGDKDRKLIIHPNSFTDWILKEQGQENNIIWNFQKYTNDKLTPRFNEEYVTKDEKGKDITIRAYSEITFSIARGDNTTINNIKISKGEESCLIWCVFYSILEQIKNVLKVAEPDDRETTQFNSLEYVFIDDPVSSLDENHLIELAVNLSMLITEISNLKFIITTHNPLFYNVLCNELKRAKRFLLGKADDGTYCLTSQENDSPFSYHLFLLTEIEKAIQSGDLKKYHYNFLRQILEKTSTFLGYKSWEDLLPDDSKKGLNGQKW